MRRSCEAMHAFPNQRPKIWLLPFKRNIGIVIKIAADFAVVLIFCMFLHAEKYSHLWFLFHEQNTSSIFSTSFLSTLLPKKSPFRANVAGVIVGFSKS